MQIIEHKSKVVRQYRDLRHTRLAEARRVAKQNSNRNLKQQALELAATVEIGDLVRVIGGRNPQFPYRLVTSFDSGGITGIQYGRTKAGGWMRRDQMSTHMSDKIREVIPAKDHALNVC